MRTARWDVGLSFVTCDILHGVSFSYDRVGNVQIHCLIDVGIVPQILNKKGSFRLLISTVKEW